MLCCLFRNKESNKNIISKKTIKDLKTATTTRVLNIHPSYRSFSVVLRDRGNCGKATKAIKREFSFLTISLTFRPRGVERIPLFQQDALSAVLFFTWGKKFDRSDRPNKLSAEVLAAIVRASSPSPSLLVPHGPSRFFFFVFFSFSRELSATDYGNKLIQASLLTDPKALLKVSDNGDDALPQWKRYRVGRQESFFRFVVGFATFRDCSSILSFYTRKFTPD